jgi:transcriptional regulator with XRE-family HTH domain
MNNELFNRVIDGLDYGFKRIRIKRGKERAKFLGYTPSYYSSLINGNEDITDDFLYKMAEKLNLNFVWLKTGEGEMLKSAASGNTINNTGNFCENTIVDYGQQLCELSNMQKEMQDMMKEKDRQISDLLTIIKNKGA